MFWVYQHIPRFGHEGAWNFKEERALFYKPPVSDVLGKCRVI